MWIKVKRLLLDPVRNMFRSLLRLNKNINNSRLWVLCRALISNGVDIIFPKFCFNCQKEGSYLCQDCQALLEISGFHRNYPSQNLIDLYFAVDYKNPLIKKIIQRFKYEPLVKELGKPLSFLIITHFQLMDNKPDFYPPERNEGEEETKSLRPVPKLGTGSADFVLIPVPLHKKRLKWRGFNQAEELSKELANFFGLSLISNCLIKIKETIPQTAALSDQARKENIKGAFLIKDEKLIKNKNILLVDDVYTTGSTLEECARILKLAGGKKIIGLTIARG